MFSVKVESDISERSKLSFHTDTIIGYHALLTCYSETYHLTKLKHIIG